MQLEPSIYIHSFLDHAYTFRRSNIIIMKHKLLSFGQDTIMLDMTGTTA